MLMKKLLMEEGEQDDPSKRGSYSSASPSNLKKIRFNMKMKYKHTSNTVTMILRKIEHVK